MGWAAASPPSPTPISSSAIWIPTSSSAGECVSTWRRRAARSRRWWRGRWASTCRRRPGAYTVWSTRTWRRPRASTASSVARTCAPIRSSPSAARGRCMAGTWAAFSRCRACSCPSGRARPRRSACSRRRWRSISSAPRPSAWTRRTGGLVNRLFAEMEAEGRAVLRGPASPTPRSGSAAARRCAMPGRATRSKAPCRRGRSAPAPSRPSPPGSRRPIARSITAHPWASPSRR